MHPGQASIKILGGTISVFLLGGAVYELHVHSGRLIEGPSQPLTPTPVPRSRLRDRVSEDGNGDWDGSVDLPLCLQGDCSSDEVVNASRANSIDLGPPSLTSWEYELLFYDSLRKEYLKPVTATTTTTEIRRSLRLQATLDWLAGLSANAYRVLVSCSPLIVSAFGAWVYSYGYRARDIKFLFARAGAEPITRFVSRHQPVTVAVTQVEIEGEDETECVEQHKNTNANTNKNSAALVATLLERLQGQEITMAQQTSTNSDGKTIQGASSDSFPESAIEAHSATSQETITRCAIEVLKTRLESLKVEHQKTLDRMGKLVDFAIRSNVSVSELTKDYNDLRARTEAQFRELELELQARGFGSKSAAEAETQRIALGMNGDGDADAEEWDEEPTSLENGNGDGDENDENWRQAESFSPVKRLVENEEIVRRYGIRLQQPGERKSSGEIGTERERDLEGELESNTEHGLHYRNALVRSSSTTGEVNPGPGPGPGPNSDLEKVPQRNRNRNKNVSISAAKNARRNEPIRQPPLTCNISEQAVTKRPEIGLRDTDTNESDSEAVAIAITDIDTRDMGATEPEDLAMPPAPLTLTTPTPAPKTPIEAFDDEVVPLSAPPPLTLPSNPTTSRPLPSPPRESISTPTAMDTSFPNPSASESEAEAEAELHKVHYHHPKLPPRFRLPQLRHQEPHAPEWPPPRPSSSSSENTAPQPQDPAIEPPDPPFFDAIEIEQPPPPPHRAPNANVNVFSLYAAALARARARAPVRFRAGGALEKWEKLELLQLAMEMAEKAREEERGEMMMMEEAEGERCRVCWGREERWWWV